MLLEFVFILFQLLSILRCLFLEPLISLLLNTLSLIFDLSLPLIHLLLISHDFSVLDLTFGLPYQLRRYIVRTSASFFAFSFLHFLLILVSLNRFWVVEIVFICTFDLISFRWHIPVPIVNDKFELLTNFNRYVCFKKF